MSQVITRRARVSRRKFLRGLSMAGSAITVGLPPLVSMFNSTGTAYAADGPLQGKAGETPIESRFVVWFNGNGIPERYWIPAEEGTGFRMTPCLAPLAPFRDDIHIVTGLDNSSAALPQPGNGHHNSMSGLMTCTRFTGRGAGGESVDQAIARKLGGDSRFRSLQIGVSQESFGESIQRNMSWAGYEKALPPEMLPDRLFDRLFGRKDQAWINQERSILDTVIEDAAELRKTLPKDDQARVEEHLDSVRDIERSITSLPPNYRKIDPPEVEDMKDWPRIAKLQSDLLAYAFITRQTRVASYMLTKCQGLSRFPWLGYTAARHHDYTHADGAAPGADGVTGQRILRDICRWHVEEFAYLLSKLKSIPEGAGTLLDHSCLVFLHEHAEANPHKNTGRSCIVAGHAGNLATGRHTRTTGTVGDLHLTLTDDLMHAGIGKFPEASQKLSFLVA
jgi:hypothetical protein